MTYLEYISSEKGKLSNGLWEPTIICRCGNRHEGDFPSVDVNECELCEGVDMDINEVDVVRNEVNQSFEIVDRDDIMVCGHCGIEEVYMEDCDCSEEVMTSFDFEEKVAEQTMGNKDEYHRILDGGRC